MQVDKTKVGRRLVYGMDSNEFTSGGVDYLITGTRREEDGKYYCDVKNLSTGNSKTIEHQRLCLIILKAQDEDKPEPEPESQHAKEETGNLFS